MSNYEVTGVESGSEFWRFSLSLYRIAGVPPACIALQDRHGLDVNVMLFALWLASKGRAVAASDLRHADGSVREWRTEAVVALRGVRRYLRSPAGAVDAKAAAALRERVKAVELEAERLQQEALFALRPANDWGNPETPEVAGGVNMDGCAAAIGAQFEDGPRKAILDAYLSLIARSPS